VKLTLTEKSHLTGNIWSFVFEPEQPLDWIAGQFVRVELPHLHADDEGTRRFFTIASAPHDKLLQISTRLTDTTFKHALAALAPGDSLRLIDLPAGDFTWQSSAAPLVFVAQGIGITPFRSMLRARDHAGKPLRAHLFYTNLTQDVPFAPELAMLEKRTSLKITHLSEPATADILARYVPDLADRTVYVSGPRSLIRLLTPPFNLPAAQLKQDYFPGYTSNNY
jgi:ferredoxin-NADP reductase